MGAERATRVVVRIKMLLDLLLGFEVANSDSAAFDHGIRTGLHLDAEAAIKIVRNAGSSKVAHLRRSLGVSIMYLHEAWCRATNTFLAHMSGKVLTADMHTKSLNAETHSKHTQQMGIVDESEIKQGARELVFGPRDCIKPGSGI